MAEDQRLQRLENQVENLSSGQERLLKQMEEMMTAMNSRLNMPDEGSVNRNRGPPGQGGFGEVGGWMAPKLTKLDFPRYDGSEDPTLWICRAEQFFDFQATAPNDQVRLAAYHLERDAQLWFQRRKNQGHLVTWEGIKAGLLERFGSTEYEDPFGELCKLKQTGTVSEYQTRFERLLARAGHLTDKQEAECFISGLKDGLRTDVRVQNPPNLSAAIGLARTYEFKTQRLTNTPISSFGRNSNTQLGTTNFSRNSTDVRTLPIRRFAPTELQRRREQGLCYNCDEKYTFGHKCKKLFLIEAEEGDELEEHKEEKDDTQETPAISLHALAGVQSPQTMRLQSSIGKASLTILIDSGSTHNFLHHKFVKIAGLKPEPGCLLSVVVANGEKLTSPGRCKGVQLQLQGTQIEADFYLLSLEGCDAVLGAQWLCTLGPILWDFDKMEMQFTKDGRQMTLRGATTSELKAIEGDTIQKTLRKNQGRGIILQLCSISVDKEPTATSEVTQNDDFRFLLTEFRDVFETPIGLPPSRSQDHQIPLQPGTGPICVRPYRYPHFQKQEIERLVEEMLPQGIIRPSQSPFSSPVLLVRKHDGSWRFCVDYRALNRQTVKDKFPIPVIDELLDELHGARFFTKLDLKSGYFQIRMNPNDVHKTAFRTHHGHFEFLVMPFGLSNAPSTFQSLMNDIFKAHLRVKVDPDKIKAMEGWPKPSTVKALRGFLGLTEADMAFELLKQSMTHAPVLVLPNFTLLFIIECDASGSGLGAVLMQEQKPIAYFSTALKGKNLLLSTYEKELMALVLAVKKWRPYLLGRHFVVRTDQRSLKYLWEQRIMTEPQQKWLLKLMGYDFSIEYKKGKSNAAADALSRRDVQGEINSISCPLPQWLEAVREENQSHPELQQIHENLQQGEAVGPWESRDGILFFKERIYLPENSPLIPAIIQEIHDSSHEGFYKSFHRIREVFFVKHMKETLKNYIKQCDVCQRHKVDHQSPSGLLQPLPIPMEVWSDISMDFIDGLPPSKGKSFLFVVVDRLSKYAHFIPMSHPYSAPKGTHFNFSSSYHPQTDGQTEAVNRTIEMYLRCFTSAKPNEWVHWISWAEFCYNTSPHTSTRKTPFEVLYGGAAPNLLTYVPGTARVEAVDQTLQARDRVMRELRTQLQQAQERMKAAYDRGRVEREFSVGDWVYLRLQPYRQTSLALRSSNKLSPRFYGPYRVLERIGLVAYRLDLPPGSKIHPVFHVSLLKKQLGAQDRTLSSLPSVADENGELQPQPSAILKHRRKGRKCEMLIQWDGLPASEATWEEEHSFMARFPHFKSP
ncbi:hypothetical protein KPL71_026714 [Citrus sinensis]|uniref:Uncharacterized protein n=1 Tax=Citrus sinensis TaxID=2711 RepID=A0ACB8I155_CITSI|nr:hypothetical protein KPL71_026714 [Citrus sinensis]